MEEWKKVICPEFTHYEVSNMGRMRNTKGVRKYKPFIGTLRKASGSSRQVCLRDIHGNKKYKFVHLIMMDTFCPLMLPSFYNRVDHIDMDPSNNVLSNTRWSNSVLNALNTKAKNVSKSSKNTWKVQIITFGNNNYYGNFPNEAEANQVAKRKKEAVFAAVDTIFLILNKVIQHQ